MRLRPKAVSLDRHAAGGAVHVLKDDLRLFAGHVLRVIEDYADGVVTELAKERAFEVVVHSSRSREVEHGLKFGVFLFAGQVGGGRGREAELRADIGGALGVRSTMAHSDSGHGMAVAE